MKQGKFEIRGETRLKNSRLVRMREELGMNQTEFARHIGMGLPTYNGYETMRIYPTEKHRTLLAKFCHCTEDDLFPEELKSYASGDQARVLVQIAEIEPLRLLGSVRKQALLVASTDSPDDKLAKDALPHDIEKALARLQPREAKVLRMYFGLGDQDAKTMDEIAVDFMVSRERIRQLRDRALNKLRGTEFLKKAGSGVLLDEHDIPSPARRFRMKDSRHEVTEQTVEGIKELRDRRYREHQK